jgi:hypothetical protein
LLFLQRIYFRKDQALDSILYCGEELGIVDRGSPRDARPRREVALARTAIQIHIGGEDARLCSTDCTGFIISGGLTASTARFTARGEFLPAGFDILPGRAAALDGLFL